MFLAHESNESVRTGWSPGLVGHLATATVL